MIRGIEGCNARGARLQYFVSARFAGSVGEYEVVKGDACSQDIQEDGKWDIGNGEWLMDHG